MITLNSNKGGGTLSNNKLSIVAGNQCRPATEGKSEGIWYYEVTFSNNLNGTLDVGNSSANLSSGRSSGGTVQLYKSFSLNEIGETIGYILDLESKKITYKMSNGLTETFDISFIKAPIFPMVGGNSTSVTATINFGASPFKYPIPDECLPYDELGAQIGDQLLEPLAGWKRYDDTDKNILYQGSGWAVSSNDKHYNKSANYTTSIDGLIKFNFYGTKIRVIISMNTSAYRATNTIKIDGTPYQYSTVSNSWETQILIYEKTDMPLGNHTVEIINDVNGKELVLDAIDIDADGTLLPPPKQVGDQLLDPDTGWKRYNNDNINFYYNGAWKYASSINYYNNDYHYTKNVGDKVHFNFKGTKLRILTAKDSATNVGGSYDVYIDNNKVGSYSNPRGVLTKCLLLYEIENLEDKEHNVEIVVTDTSRLAMGATFDIIDIDENGELLSPSTQIGDQLLEPDTGWRRYDDSDTSITYIVNDGFVGQSAVASNGYNQTIQTIFGGAEARFNFKGSKLRIISLKSTKYNIIFQIYIDGILYSPTIEKSSINTYSVLMLEISSLDNGEHSVIIKGIGDNVSTMGYLDAIDIDKNGELLPYDPNPIRSLIKSNNKIYTSVNDTWIEVAESISDNVFKSIGMTEEDLLNISQDQWERLKKPVEILILSRNNVSDIDLGYDYKELIPPLANITVPPYTLLDTLEDPKLLIYSENGTPAVEVRATANPQLVKPNGDIKLKMLEKINNITLQTNESGAGNVRIIFSVDSGLTWKTYNSVSLSFEDININNLESIKVKGMDVSTFNSIGEKWNEIVTDSKIRFAYYLEIDDITDEAEVDKLSINMNLTGRWKKAVHTVDYDYEYDNEHIYINFKVSGSYKINYAE